MTSSATVHELYVMRSIACLSIVFLHCIGIGLITLNSNGIGSIVFNSIHLLLYFGTPMFIFLSEFLLAYSYRKKQIPSDFLIKRVKLIFLPFVFMAFFYSIPYATSLESWSLKLFLNVFIGDYHGYFILIIFQFYLLHLVLTKYLRKWNPKPILTITFFITIAYLAFFNFTDPLPLPFADYIWERFYWVPFLGWLFYFALGYYCGLYYEQVVEKIKQYKVFVLLAPIVSSTLLLVLYYTDYLPIHSSKRIDILFHTTAMCLFILYVARQIKSIPPIFITVNNYSFGIYLVHMFYISIVDVLYPYLPFLHGYHYIVFLFFVSVSGSILTAYYANKWKYGKYLVGKINKAPIHTPPLFLHREKQNQPVKTYYSS